MKGRRSGEEGERKKKHFTFFCLQGPFPLIPRSTACTVEEFRVVEQVVGRTGPASSKQVDSAVMMTAASLLLTS